MHFFGMKFALRHKPEVDTLNIEIPYALGMGLNKLFAWIHSIAHEHIEGTVCFGGIIHGDEE
jgi:hypothetical protein